MKPIRLTAAQALTRLEDACARCEMCRGEAIEKLYRWGIPGSEHDAIIESLTTRRFIDDRRYAKAYVRDRMNFAHWGRKKIESALAAKRIDRAIINETLDDVDANEFYAIAYNVMKTRLRGNLPITDRNQFVKAMRYGVQRGFDPSMVVRIIRELNDEFQESC